MSNSAAILAALGLLPALCSAAEPAALDEEFLEYLSQFETDKDDWTWFASEEEVDEAKTKGEVAAKEKAAQKQPVKNEERVKP